MVLELVGGFIYLLLAGDLLVRGAVALSRRARISPLVVGLTVVAFGTSAPELFVSLGSVFSGYPGIAIGNVVGSNIANVLLVLGVPALLYPTACNQGCVGRDCTLMVLASVLFAVFCLFGPLHRLEGLLLFSMLVGYLVYTARNASDANPVVEGHPELERVLGLPTRRRMIALFLGLGAVGLPLGAHLLIDGAVQLAAALGVSESVVGLTLIAIGTSLPELATTVVAAYHRHAEVAVGNVVGSNLFNLGGIMGLTALLAPGPIPVPESFLTVHIPVMLVAALLLASYAWMRGAIGRKAGLAFLTAYAAYLLLLYQPAPPGGAAPRITAGVAAPDAALVVDRP